MEQELADSWSRSQAACATLAAPADPLRQKAEQEMERDILSALTHSRFSQASLAQIARYMSVPIEVVEAIAQQLAGDYLGRDLERLEFESISKQIQKIDIRGIARTAPLQILSDWQVEQMVGLETEAAALPPGSTIIIDSITAINRNCLFSENDTEYARPILQICDLARKYGHTVILIHHSNAEGNARGTRAIHNSVDAVWGMSITNDDPDSNTAALRSGDQAIGQK